MRRGSFLFNTVTCIVIAKRDGGIGGFDTSSPPPPPLISGRDGRLFPQVLTGFTAISQLTARLSWGGGWRDPPGGGEDTPPLAVAHTNSFNVTYL